MIYAKDQWIQLPTKDLYDTQIMMASVSAARDMYEKGQKQMDDFYDKFGTFFSPIQKDMDWYNQNVIGGLQKTLDQIEQNGYSPTKSPEGRAAISNFLNRLPRGTIQQLKVNAEKAKGYYALADKMKASGIYGSDDYQQFMSDGFNPYTFGTVNPDGTINDWRVGSPYDYKTLQEFVHPSFQAIKPHMLDEKEVKSRGYKYDPIYDYTGITRGDMENIVGSMQNMPGIQGNKLYQYYRGLAKQQVIAKGEDPTEANINKQFADNAITADSQILTPLEYKPNPYRMANYENQLALARQIQQQNFQREMKQDEMAFKWRMKYGPQNNENYSISKELNDAANETLNKTAQQSGQKKYKSNNGWQMRGFKASVRSNFERTIAGNTIPAPSHALLASNTTLKKSAQENGGNIIILSNELDGRNYTTPEQLKTKFVNYSANQKYYKYNPDNDKVGIAAGRIKEGSGGKIKTSQTNLIGRIQNDAIVGYDYGKKAIYQRIQLYTQKIIKDKIVPDEYIGTVYKKYPYDGTLSHTESKQTDAGKVALTNWDARYNRMTFRASSQKTNPANYTSDDEIFDNE